jgi:SAM-dependent methyltransferase
MSSVAYIGHAIKARPALSPWLFVVAVFVSAALVFLVEPLVGKLLLPLLGGSPAIWNTSLAFFQLALLAGYGYAHALQRLTSVRRQMAVHLLVLAAAALVLPLRITGLLGQPWVHAPALWLAAALALSLGPPFAALSATAPLLQTWYARLNGDGDEGANPYSLYAASNLGSVLALAAYPIVVEPLVGLSAQAHLWSFAYAGFTLFLIGLAAMAWRLPTAAVPVMAPVVATEWHERWIWVCLAAAPASLLTGVTSHLTADVASAPFMWVIPLELYLATFVVAFSGKAKGPSATLLVLQVLAVPASLALLFEPTTPWPEQIVIHLAAFFVTALVCHQALGARRPEPARLTEFYLCLSIGGVIGGGFNAFLAPLLFPDVWEYPAVLVLACLARPGGTARRGMGWLAAGLVWIAPLCIPALALPDILREALMLAPVVVAVMLRDRTIAVVALFAALALAGEVQGIGRYREHHRSFFGVIHIAEVHPKGLGTASIMVHGTTLHGVQAQGRGQKCRATAYYAPATVIGGVFGRERAKGPRRMGVVGLGAGTVATFVRPGDSMRFFEIDPLVERLTLDPNHFSFIHGCAKGPVDVVLGDARLSIAHEPAASYDLLLIDAFSSDSVPTHLLTVEALHSYLRLLKPHGVLLLHLSNRNLELTGPAAAAAKAAGASYLKGVHWVEEGTSPYLESSGIVLLVAPDARSLDPYRNDREWTDPVRPARAWTDDYTNVWGAMIARFKGET